IVRYDGSPLLANCSILFDMAQREQVTAFGTSPRYLSAIAKEGLEPRATHDLSALRTILSTGSPLSCENFDYVYSKIKPDVCLSSMSGGTDLCSCFALGNPIAPVYRGELQTPGLGMKVFVYDESGQPVVGEKGELVCAAPFPPCLSASGAIPTMPHTAGRISSGFGVSGITAISRRSRSTTASSSTAA